MSVGYITTGDDEDEYETIRCERCRAQEGVRVRTSTTQRLEGGRPLVVLECTACQHSWKIIGHAPVRLLAIRRPRRGAPL